MSRDATFKSGKFSYPGGVRLANWLLSSFKNHQFDQSRLIEKAIKKSGLKDFGSDFWMVPMQHLLTDLNVHTKFHPFGAFLMDNKLVQNLINRLWTQYWINEEPQILSPLPPTVMITGLQRTGTTFLQRLLGALPEFRGVISWEIVNPVPTSKRKNYYGKYQAWLGHKALNYINPEFKSIHSVDYDSLEEEVVLMDHCFMSSIFEAAFTTPDYSRWLEDQDHLPAYLDLKMWLQFLLWRHPAEKFLLLKSPHHMEHLDAFASVFPGAKIIHTHRHPADTMASYCSMIHLAKKIFQPLSDPIEVGKHWLRKNKLLVDKCREYKLSNPDQFVDVAYKDLVDDPLATARTVYQQLGLTWTDMHTDVAEKFCRKNRKNKYGKHIYHLADYGLSPKDIEEHFGLYLDEYKDFI